MDGEKDDRDVYAALCVTILSLRRCLWSVRVTGMPEGTSVTEKCYAAATRQLRVDDEHSEFFCDAHYYASQRVRKPPIESVIDLPWARSVRAFYRMVSDQSFAGGGPDGCTHDSRAIATDLVEVLPPCTGDEPCLRCCATNGNLGPIVWLDHCLGRVPPEGTLARCVHDAVVSMHEAASQIASHGAFTAKTLAVAIAAAVNRSREDAQR